MPCGVGCTRVDHADGYCKYRRAGWDADLDGDALRKPGGLYVNYSNWQCRRLVDADAVVVILASRVRQSAPDIIVVSVSVRNRDNQPGSHSRRHTFAGSNP